MRAFARVQNSGFQPRDLRLEWELSREGTQGLKDAFVRVIGSHRPERVALEASGALTLQGLEPGESRWIELAYSLPGSEPVSLTFFERGKTKYASGFTFLLTPVPLPALLHKTLRAHLHLFQGGARSTKREPSASPKGTPTSERTYRAILERDLDSISHSVAALLAVGHGDPFGLATSLETLQERLGGKDTSPLAVAHASLMRAHQACQTMMATAGGEAASVPHTVRWQLHLLGKEAFRGHAPAEEIRHGSEAFLVGFANGKVELESYPAFLWELFPLYEQLLSALPKSRERAKEALGRMVAAGGAAAALQGAHRQLLLALAGRDK